MQHAYFQERTKIPFDPSKFVKDVCKGKIFTSMLFMLYTTNTKALGLLVSDKKIFKVFIAKICF